MNTAKPLRKKTRFQRQLKHSSGDAHRKKPLKETDLGVP